MENQNKSVLDGELSKIPTGDRIRPAEKKSEPKEEPKEEAEERIIPQDDFDDESEDDESLDDDDEDDSDEDEDTVKISKKELQVLQKKAAKSSKKDQQIEELRGLLGKKSEDVSDEDFADLTEELAKELGIEDKDNAGKLVKIMAKLNKRQIKTLQDKLDKYESRETEKAVASTYQSEFQSFSPTLKSEFANLSDSDFKAVSDLMYTLSHTPGIGGVEYVDTDGKRKLNPYDLDYIFFKNKSKFDEIVGTKKVRGMETGRTRESTFRDSSAADKPLTRNSSVSDIAARDRAIREAESKRDVLRDGGNNRI